MKKMIPAALLVLLLFGVVAAASVTGYATTAPTFGHKTLAQNQKSTTEATAYHTSYTSGLVFRCWLDAQLVNGSSSWTLVSGNFDGGTLPGLELRTAVPYELLPTIGKNVRLRTRKPDGRTLGGQMLSGSMDFR